MAADLTELAAAARTAAPRDPAVAAALQAHLRLVEAWIKVRQGCESWARERGMPCC